MMGLKRALSLVESATGSRTVNCLRFHEAVMSLGYGHIHVVAHCLGIPL